MINEGDSSVDKSFDNSTASLIATPVKNAELWQRLDALRSLHHVEWRWVKGHSGDPGNERADALANRGVEAAS